MKRLILILLLALSPVLVQSQNEHEGQPERCHNIPAGKDSEEFCECEKSCDKDAMEDPICQVWCRKDHCDCRSDCDS